MPARSGRSKEAKARRDLVAGELAIGRNPADLLRSLVEQPPGRAEHRCLDERPDKPLSMPRLGVHQCVVQSPKLGVLRIGDDVGLECAGDRYGLVCGECHRSRMLPLHECLLKFVRSRDAQFAMPGSRAKVLCEQRRVVFREAVRYAVTGDDEHVECHLTVERTCPRPAFVRSTSAKRNAVKLQVASGGRRNFLRGRSFVVPPDVPRSAPPV
jgi:hypothetical protein